MPGLFFWRAFCHVYEVTIIDNSTYKRHQLDAQESFLFLARHLLGIVRILTSNDLLSIMGVLQLSTQFYLLDFLELILQITNSWIKTIVSSGH